MSKAKEHHSSWRKDASPDLIRDISCAIDVVCTQIKYETDARSCGGKKRTVAQTLEDAQKIIDTASLLRDLLQNMSPILRSMLFYLPSEMSQNSLEAGPFQHPQIGQTLSILTSLLRSGEHQLSQAIDRLTFLHTPYSDGGQGSGSSMGRESDLRAFPSGGPNFVGSKPHHKFRTPKDKFALSVIRALLVDEHPAVMAARGKQKRLAAILDEVWADTKLGGNPNWERVLKTLEPMRADVEKIAPPLRILRASRRKRYELQRNGEDPSE